MDLRTNSIPTDTNNNSGMDKHTDTSQITGTNNNSVIDTSNDKPSEELHHDGTDPLSNQVEPMDVTANLKQKNMIEKKFWN